MKVKFPIYLKSRRQLDKCMKFLEEKGVHWRSGREATDNIVLENIDYPTLILFWDGVNRKHPNALPYLPNNEFITYLSYDSKDCIDYEPFEKEF